MADYIAILDSQIDPLAPVTSELMYQLRDNPLAIAESDFFAPGIHVSAVKTAYAHNDTFYNTTASGVSLIGTMDTTLARPYIINFIGRIIHNVSSAADDSEIWLQRSTDNVSWTNAYKVSQVDFTVPTRTITEFSWRVGTNSRYFRLYASGDSDHQIAVNVSTMWAMGY